MDRPDDQPVTGNGEGGPYEDYPFEEVAAALEERLKEGFTFFQKFTCGGCGQRLTMDTPDRLHTTGGCDKCDTVTDIQAKGCNYLLVRMPLAKERTEP